MITRFVFAVSLYIYLNLYKLVLVVLVTTIVLEFMRFGLQEIGVLVTQFSLFHACIGLILPSLARLRTMFVHISFFKF